MKLFQNPKSKIVNYVLRAAIIIFVLVVVILGSTQESLARNHNFGSDIIAVAVLAIVSIIVSVIFDYGFIPLISSALLSVTLGLIVNGGAEVINDHMLNIQFSGGIYDNVVLYIVLFAIAAGLSIIDCFLTKDIPLFNKVKKVDNA